MPWGHGADRACWSCAIMCKSSLRRFGWVISASSSSLGGVKTGDAAERSWVSSEDRDPPARDGGAKTRTKASMAAAINWPPIFTRGLILCRSSIRPTMTMIAATVSSPNALHASIDFPGAAGE